MQTRVDAQIAAPRAAPTRHGLGRVGLQEMVAGYGFVLPSFLVLTIFLILPILASLALVFMKYDLLTPPTWVGVRNIAALFTDRRLGIAYWNTLRFTLGATFLNTLLGLLLAMAVNRSMPKVIRYFVRTALFFPVLTTASSLALVWRFILTQDRGILNYLLQQVGLNPVPWLSSSTWALPSVILYDVWRACGRGWSLSSLSVRLHHCH